MSISLATTLRATVATAAAGAMSVGCALAHTSPVPPLEADPAAPYTLIQEPDAGLGPITKLITSATTSVKLVMYELADDDIVNDLIAAHRRGLTVQVLLDSAFHGRNTNTRAYNALKAAGVEVKWASDDVIVHEKALIVDGQAGHIAAVSTGNMTKKFYQTGRDAWIIDTAPQDVSAITTTFDGDFTSADAIEPLAAVASSHLLWSPGARPAFVRLIDSATRTVNVTSEELSDRTIIVALSRAARRGVACRIVMTDNPAWATAIDALTASGCSVHLLPATPNALYMHEKSILVDGTTLDIGSTNLSTASLQYNRELSLQLDTTTAPQVISAVAATFDHDYQLAQPAGSSTH